MTQRVAVTGHQTICCLPTYLWRTVCQPWLPEVKGSFYHLSSLNLKKEQYTYEAVCSCYK